MTYRWPLLYWGPVRTGNVFVTGPPVLGLPSVQLDTLLVVHSHCPPPGVSADTGHVLELVSDVTGGGTGAPVSQLPLSVKKNILLEITILLIDITGNQLLFVSKKILWHFIELCCSKYFSSKPSPLKSQTFVQITNIDLVQKSAFAS